MLVYSEVSYIRADNSKMIAIEVSSDIDDTQILDIINTIRCKVFNKYTSIFLEKSDDYFILKMHFEKNVLYQNMFKSFDRMDESDLNIFIQNIIDEIFDLI